MGRFIIVLWWPESSLTKRLLCNRGCSLYNRTLELVDSTVWGLGLQAFDRHTNTLKETRGGKYLSALSGTLSGFFFLHFWSKQLSHVPETKYSKLYLSHYQGDKQIFGKQARFIDIMHSNVRAVYSQGSANILHTKTKVTAQYIVILSCTGNRMIHSIFRYYVLADALHLTLYLRPMLRCWRRKHNQVSTWTMIKKKKSLHCI